MVFSISDTQLVFPLIAVPFFLSTSRLHTPFVQVNAKNAEPLSFHHPLRFRWKSTICVTRKQFSIQVYFEIFGFVIMYIDKIVRSAPTLSDNDVKFH